MGCGLTRRLDALWSAEAQDFIEKIEVRVSDGQHKRCTLSALGLET